MQTTETKNKLKITLFSCFMQANNAPKAFRQSSELIMYCMAITHGNLAFPFWKKQNPIVTIGDNKKTIK